MKMKAIDRFIESLFESDKNAVAEKLSMAITKIAVNFIPKKNKVEKQMTDSAQKHPLQFLMTTKLMSEDGYALASIGSLDDDYDQNLLHHFSQNLHFESIFLRAALEELKKRYTKEQLYEAIVMSPVFIPKDEEHTMRLLDAFYSDDYLVVSALSIPLIEDGVRRLFKLNKLNYLKPSQTGGFDVRGLGSLFKQGLIKEIFGPLGENVQYYFSVVLTEQVGWNLKNNYSHGLNKWAFSEAKYADRLFHILLCLALIRPNLDSDLVA